ncbi:hypothetical protein CEXT_53901 [Caerostris extrusa]|uniref:Uncharacterized protein n=1 Tax=Caerostris extrusa TaxID=172846 RepID=A0AAV4TUE1_CAEEX|nr:hypothetical protein CEXT_53901 [Caerostris extrusa]
MSFSISEIHLLEHYIRNFHIAIVPSPKAFSKHGIFHSMHLFSESVFVVVFPSPQEKREKEGTRPYSFMMGRTIHFEPGTLKSNSSSGGTEGSRDPKRHTVLDANKIRVTGEIPVGWSGNKRNVPSKRTAGTISLFYGFLNFWQRSSIFPQSYKKEGPQIALVYREALKQYGPVGSGLFVAGRTGKEEEKPGTLKSNSSSRGTEGSRDPKRHAVLDTNTIRVTGEIPRGAVGE